MNNISNVKCSPKVEEFLRHSNYIEKEYSETSLRDAKLAWMSAHLSRNKIDVKYILAIHKILMQNLRNDIAGKVRNCDVWIGGVRKLFVNKELIYKQIVGWLKFYKNLQIFDKEKPTYFYESKCKRAHIDFENIHPFEDGNGRIGRILYNIHRLNCNLPIHIIHEGDEQMRYYEWFGTYKNI